MWNLKLIIYIATLILISLFIGLKRPDMPKQAVITGSEYDFVEIGVDENRLPQKTENINIVNTSPESNQNIGMNNVKVKNVGGGSEVKAVRSGSKVQTVPVRTNTVKQTTSQPKTTPSQPKQTEQPKVVQQTTTAQQKPVEQPKVIDVKPTQNIENKSKPILTEQEEIIAWNHWRSRLQNQVMMDSKISAPLGTQFKFSFTVDKYGNMSNVKVWSTNPSYSDLAVRVIKPVLMSYRNQRILNFPYGTRRIITNVEGGFVMSRTSRYSSPSDYHDYEHVKH